MKSGQLNWVTGMWHARHAQLSWSDMQEPRLDKHDLSGLFGVRQGLKKVQIVVLCTGSMQHPVWSGVSEKIRIPGVAPVLQSHQHRIQNAPLTSQSRKSGSQKRSRHL